MPIGKVIKLILFLFTVTLTTAVARSGQQKEDRQAEQAGLFVGAGILIKDEPLKGIGAEVLPLPFYMYRGKAFSMRGLSATYDVLGDENWAFRGLVSFRTDGYDADDSSDLDGMSDRRNTLDLGAELWFENSWGNIGLDWLGDALGIHKGHETKLAYTSPFRAAFGMEKLTLRPMVGVSWRNKNLNNYYYGVRAKEAAAGRPAYKSGDSLNPYAGIALDYQLDSRWSVFAMFRNEWLGSEITDSPIVDQDNIISVILGLVYRF